MTSRVPRLPRSSSSLRARSRPKRLGALLDILWRDFNSPTFDVFIKLWVAAADDPELHAHLVPVESRLTEEIASLSGEVVPEGIEPGRQWSRRLSIAFSTIRGLALTEHFEPRGHPHRDPWPETRLTLLELLAPGLEPSHRKET